MTALNGRNGTNCTTFCTIFTISETLKEKVSYYYYLCRFTLRAQRALAQGPAPRGAPRLPVARKKRKIKEKKEKGEEKRIKGRKGEKEAEKERKQEKKNQVFLLFPNAKISFFHLAKSDLTIFPFLALNMSFFVKLMYMES